MHDKAKVFDFSIGCDPELFVKVISGTNAARNRLISAHDLIPGTKKEPFRVADGFIQVDGTALEFNTDPAATYIQFERNIRSVMSDLRDILPSKYVFFIASSVRYPHRYWETLPMVVKRLGCDPDYSAYTCTTNTRVRPLDFPLCTGAGHIHLGWGKNLLGKEDHFAHNIKLARLFDVTLNPKLKHFEKNTRRQELYGKPGDFRPKDYGIEYRTPSNQWIRSSSRMSMVYEEVMHVAEAYFLNGGDEKMTARVLDVTFPLTQPE